jgi:excisionase family DNA binding protein
MSKISVTEASEILGVSRQRVLTLIKEGRVAAEMAGNSYILDNDEVVAYAAIPKKSGRPSKQPSQMYLWGAAVAAAESILLTDDSPPFADKAVSQPQLEMPRIVRRIVESGRDDRRFAAAISKLNDVPPAHPTLAQQGDFWLGYYHYRQPAQEI